MSTSSNAVRPLWDFPWMLPHGVTAPMPAGLMCILHELNAFPEEPQPDSPERMDELLNRLTDFSSDDSCRAPLQIAWVLGFRHAIRAGSWELLAWISHALIQGSRHMPPCKLQGIAAGLLAEWALAAGDGKTAMIYARESLGSRGEVQRIRGYLALAHALIGDTDGARVQTLCAREATRQQANLSSCADFAQLQHLRIQLLLGDVEPSPTLGSFRLPTVRAMAGLAIWLRHPSLVTQAGLDEAVEELWRRGRLRDLLLAAPCLPARFTERIELAAAYRDRYDLICKTLPAPSAYPVTDGENLQALPSSLRELPPETIWSCI